MKAFKANFLIASLLVAATIAVPTVADSMQCRCDIYLAGEDHADSSGPCIFSQRQGYITISLENGISYELTPVGNQPGNYHNQHGSPVYRESGLGRAGQIFRFADESVYVYWQTKAAGEGDNSRNPTAPYSSLNYDATTLLACGSKGSGTRGSCPAGILRMESGEASIVVTSPGGEEFTLNFMKSYINAGGRKVVTELQGDTWIVTVDDTEVYEVPLAAINGG